VIIDRFKVYKKVVKKMFPNALIILDKFHLIAEVNSALDKVRKRLQKEKMGKRYGGVLRFESKLRQAYRLKERFRKGLDKRICGRDK